MKSALRTVRLCFGGSGKGTENRLCEHQWQQIRILDRVGRSFTTSTESPTESRTPIEVDEKVSQQIKDAVESNNSPLAYDLLCAMINNEQREGAPKPEFRDFVHVLEGLRSVKGRKSADMAIHTLEQLIVRIDEKRLSDYHDISELVTYVISVLTTCTTAPKRIKMKNIRDIFDIAQLASSILADVESRPDFTPTRDIYNIVLNSYTQTTIVASQAHQLGEDYQETLNYAIMAAENAERLLTRMIESTSERERPNGSSFRLLIQAWCHVPSPDASDRILLILNAMEENLAEVDASIYSMVFNAFAQTAPMIEFDPADPTVPANKAVALLRRLVTKLKDDNPPPLNAMCYASVVNALAKSEAPRNFGDLAPASLAEACLRQISELHEIGLLKEGPNDYCYGNSIAAWTRHADVNIGALKAESLLEHLEELGRVKFNSDQCVQRRTTWFNMVLYAFSRSTLTDAPERAEALFSRMESSSINDGFSCDAVIATWAKNPHVYEDRGERALKCLSRTPNPTIICYNSTLAACAANGPEFAKNGLATAEKVFSEIGSPNAATYGRMMSVYNNLLSHKQEEKRARLERVFLQCCRNGHVTLSSLRILEAGMGTQNFERLLRSHKVEMPHGKLDFSKLPSTWTWRVNRSKRHIIVDAK
jgi:hypothetical protein